MLRSVRGESQNYTDNGKHKLCGARVENIAGRRLTRAELERIHDETCPAVLRIRASTGRRGRGSKGDRDASSDDG